jgi:hypothetical protein
MNQVFLTAIIVVAMLSITAIAIPPIALAQNMSGEIKTPSRTEHDW